MNNNSWVIIVLVIIVILVLLYSGNNKEYFNQNNDYINTINNNYDGGIDKGISEYLIDNAPCSPGCCGNPGQVSYNNLTNDELRQTLLKNSQSGLTGKYISNGFGCSGSKGGCPCIDLNTAKFLASRGNNTTVPDSLDKDFFVNGGNFTQDLDQEYQSKELNYSDYSDYTVQPTLPSKEQQIKDMMY